MNFLFCTHPTRPSEIDPDFSDEASVARATGASVCRFNLDRFLDTGSLRPTEPLGRDSEASAELCYRGWMLAPASYATLHAQLSERGLALINRPDQYRLCHHLPLVYPIIETRTARTRWLSGGPPFEIEEIMAVLEPFGGGPVVLKDFVKSQKHYWNEACYIPNSSDEAAVSKVVERFIALQCDEVEGGLVFREYLPIRTIGTHPISGLRLSHEYRVFWLDHVPVVAWPYWDAADVRVDSASIPIADFVSIAERIDSRFFTMDIAELVDGSWVIVETGDGQVSGLPDHADAGQLFAAIAAE